MVLLVWPSVVSAVGALLRVTLTHSGDDDPNDLRPWVVHAGEHHAAVCRRKERQMTE